MTSDLVKLSEDEHVFRIEGSSLVSFMKLSGLVIMQHHPIHRTIPKEKVLGLFIGENEAGGSSLYLGLRKGSLHEHTYLGKISDLASAQDFVSRINESYELCRR